MTSLTSGGQTPYAIIVPLVVRGLALAEAYCLLSRQKSFCLRDTSFKYFQSAGMLFKLLVLLRFVPAQIGKSIRGRNVSMPTQRRMPGAEMSESIGNLSLPPSEASAFKD